MGVVVCMKKLIAIGNRFMTDDGIAITVAENMKQRLEELGYEVIIGETDYRNCFFSLSEQDFIIILDALFTNDEPGIVKIFSFEEVLSSSPNVKNQHEMSLIDFMRLYNRDYKGFLIGIEVADIGYGEKISAVLQDKLTNICSLVENILIRTENLYK